MVEDPYTFGKIAAANALSDIWAMGGDVVLALNIVAFPEKLPPSMLGDMLRGGAEKVAEAGGVLAGGHSIHDDGVKYGLSVMGTVHPERIRANNTANAGDVLILTKPLGVGIITTAYKVGEAAQAVYDRAIISMQTLNKYAADHMKPYNVHACTDVTGFGLLGHLREMLRGDTSAVIECSNIRYFPEALECAGEYLLTAGGQRNRNFVGHNVRFEGVSSAMQEILFDPQTSGGLLIAVNQGDADELLARMLADGIQAGIIGRITQRQEDMITVRGAAK